MIDGDVYSICNTNGNSGTTYYIWLQYNTPVTPYVFYLAQSDATHATSSITIGYASSMGATCTNIVSGVNPNGAQQGSQYYYYSFSNAVSSQFWCFTLGPGPYQLYINELGFATPVCTAGSYYTGSACAACPAGSYCTGDGLKTACSAGFTSAQSSTSYTACTICGLNSYSTAGAGSCTACPANSWSRAGASACTANPGYYLVGSTPTACTTTCPSGTVHCSPAGAAVCCTSGQYFVEGTSSSCQTCAAGTYGSGAASACTACAANTYSAAGAGSCTACPVNTWSNDGADSCRIVCSSGNIASAPGAVQTYSLSIGNGDLNLGTGPTSYTYVTPPVGLGSVALLASINSNSIPQGIQTWTVGMTGTYFMVAAGAAGASYSTYTGGYGIVVSATYTFTAGQTVAIAVGQTPYGCAGSAFASGGGGTYISIFSGTGSFSSSAQHTPVLVAGGGGGVGQTSPNNGANAVLGTSGTLCPCCSGTAASNGGGGGAGNSNGGNGAPGSSTNGIANAAGGGGFYYKGGDAYASNTLGGNPFVSATGPTGGMCSSGSMSVCTGGVTGSTVFPYGGFGSGGGGWNAGGGGGGYSGGQGSPATNRCGGGAGGSYDATNSAGSYAAKQYSSWDSALLGVAPNTFSAGYNTGSGFVYIVPLCTPCKAGMYGSGRQCTACAANTYSAAGSSSCSSCSDLGKWSPAGSWTCYPYPSSVYSLIAENSGTTCGGKCLKALDVYSKTITPLSNSAMSGPTGIAFSPGQAYILVCDTTLHKIKRVTLASGWGATLDIVAGTGTGSRVDGPGSSASFNSPTGISVSPDGTFALITDSISRAVRRMDLTTTSFTVTTVAGTCSGTSCTSGALNGQALSSTFGVMNDIDIDPTGTYAVIADGGNCVIRKLDLVQMTVNTLAGSGSCVTTPVDNFGTSASFGTVQAVRFSPDNQKLFVADLGCKAIRVISLFGLGVSTLITVGYTLMSVDVLGLQDTLYVSNNNYGKLDSITYPGAADSQLISGLNSPVNTRVFRYTVPGIGVDTDNSVCVQCPAGKYSFGNGLCLSCPMGTYSSSTASTACCPLNSSPGAGGCVSNQGYSPLPVVQTGGTVGYSSSAGGGQYVSFTSGTGTFMFSQPVLAQVLVVGGGGSGGSRSGGGGGAGALIYTTTTFAANTVYTATVGAGGTATNPDSSGNGKNGNSGGSSSIYQGSTPLFVALGGGGGGGSNTNGIAGGSTGGASSFSNPGSVFVCPSPTTSNTPSGTYGYTGGSGSDVGLNSCSGDPCWAGGGGGGAGGNGYSAVGYSSTSSFAKAGAGGNGIALSITGTTVVYAAGGGGGGNSDLKSGAGAGGGAYINGVWTVSGGAGTYASTNSAGNAVANTGSGGGGSGYATSGNLYIPSGAGGSGIVVVQFEAYVACPAGSVAAAGARTCSALTCSAGTYPPSLGASTCTSCLGGTYSLSSASACTNCASGSYSGSGASVCSTCVGGTYSGAAASLCSSCVSGTFSSPGLSACSNCVGGTYSGPAAPSCSSCPGGTYSGSTASSCLVCAAGSFSAAGVSFCTSCSAGSYSASPQASLSSACLACQAGTYSGAGASACTSCPTGTYSGSLQAVSSLTCTACAAGTFSASPGATSSGACFSCPASSYAANAGSSACSQCINGTTSQAGSVWCVPPVGYYIQSAPVYVKSLYGNSSGILYPALQQGQYLTLDGTVPPSTIDWTSGPINVTGTKGGINVSMAGSTVLSMPSTYFPVVADDSGNPVTPALWYQFSSSNCLKDSSGGGNDLVSYLGTIASCASAQTVQNFGSVQNLKGNAWTVQYPWSFSYGPQNFYSGLTISFWFFYIPSAATMDLPIMIMGGCSNNPPNAADSCQLTSGFMIYITSSGLRIGGTQYNLLQMTIPSDNSWHHYQFSFSGYNPSTVNAWIDGTSKCLVDVLYSPGVCSSPNQIGLAYTYSNYFYQLGVASVVYYSGNTPYFGPAANYMLRSQGGFGDFRIYSSALGDNQAKTLYSGRADVMKKNLQLSQCTGSCSAGQTLHCTILGVGVCCGLNTYFRESVDSACQACAAGYSADGSGSTCTSCPAGQFVTGASCSSCAAGTYSSAVSQTACSACPAGTFSAAVGASANSTCSACAAGKYQNASGASSQSLCLPCPAGTYSGVPAANSSSFCTACVAGTYSTGLAMLSVGNCSQCQAGTYQPTTGASSGGLCLPCAAGTYSASAGAGTVDGCVYCPAGSFGASQGASSLVSCVGCQNMTYALAPGSTVCTACPLNSSSGPGATQCTANVGYYRELFSVANITGNGVVQSPPAECYIVINRDPSTTVSGFTGNPVYINSSSGYVNVSQARMQTLQNKNGYSMLADGPPVLWYKFDSQSCAAEAVGGTYTVPMSLVNGPTCSSSFTSAYLGTPLLALKGDKSIFFTAAPKAFMTLTLPASFWAVMNSKGGFSISLWGVLVYVDGRFQALLSLRTEVVGCASSSYFLDLTQGYAGMNLKYVLETEGPYVQLAGTDVLTTPTQSLWAHHVLSIDSSSRVTYYVNGVLTVCPTCSSALISYVTNGAYNVQLGFGTWQPTCSTYNIDGGIDDLRIYSGVLTQAQVNELYLGSVQVYGATGRFLACQGSCAAGTTKHCTFYGASVCCGANTFFRDSIDVACQPCPANQSSDGSTSSCSTCAANQIVLNGACQTCQANFYCQNLASIPCPNGTYSLAGSSSVAQCMCPGNASVGQFFNCSCNPGYQRVDNASLFGGWQCVPCSANTYCSVGVLKSCPVNSTSPALSGDITACQCYAGLALSVQSAVCVVCPAGYYSSAGSQFCSACPAYSNTTAAGSTQLAACVCYSAYSGPYGGPCALCTANRYCSGNSSVACPNGTYSLAGSSSALQCGCPALSVLLPLLNCTCVDGYQQVANASVPLGGWQCNPCAANQYCSLGVLRSCPANSASPALSSALSQCVCNNGYYWNATSSTCILCPAGYYCSLGALVACPPSTSSPAGSVVQTDCKCNPGFRCDQVYVARISITLSMTSAQFEQQKQQILSNISSAAGVPASSVALENSLQTARRLLELSGSVPVHASVEVVLV